MPAIVMGELIRRYHLPKIKAVWKQIIDVFYYYTWDVFLNTLQNIFSISFNSLSLLKYSSVHFSLVFAKFGSNYVRCLISAHSKPKIVCLSSITKSWTCLCQLDARKNGVRECLMCQFVNIVTGPTKFDVQCLFVRSQK